MLRRKKCFIMLATAVLAVTLGGCGGPESSIGQGMPEEENAGRQGVPKEETVLQTPSPQPVENASVSQEELEDSSLPMAVSLGDKHIDWIAYSEGRYCYRQGALFGFLAEDGSEIIPCIYSSAAPFSEGLACVCLDGKYGYIGKDGETVLPFVYDQASPFQEGRAYYCRGEEYGLIDRESLEELRLEGYESISTFREGLAYFSRDGLYGYLDRDGQEVIEPIYDDAGYFYDGLAMVRKNGLCGVIERDGREILPCRYLKVDIKEMCIVAEKEEGKYCFDREGGALLDGAWYYIREEEGMISADGEDRRVLADGRGKILYETAGDSYFAPIAGRELVVVRDEEENYGIVDYEGQIVVPFEYAFIYNKIDEVGLSFREAFGKEGYWDVEDFSVKIPPISDRIGEFVMGRAETLQYGKYGVLRTDGTLELPCEYDKISLFSDGSMALWTGDTVELRDSQGNPIHSGKYQYISEVGDGYELVADWHHSYRDRQGRLVVSDYQYSMNSVPGSENTYLLEDSTLLMAAQESGTDLDEVFLRNRITPEAGLFAKLCQNGSFSYQDQKIPIVQITELGGLERYERVCYKLYRIGEEKVLYFHAAPWEQASFPESCSGLYTVRDGEVKQLLSGYECGGSMRGDYVCFMHDREEDTWKPGIWGRMGGFGGYLTYREVYTLQDGEATQESSVSCYNHSVGDCDQEELMENAELFYDAKDNPYTAETILELESTENVTEYSVNDRRVAMEVYSAEKERYREFLPLGLDW
ncbi:MAG: WG repeat-containing protein [bacterium]|nr:WG repeat-containing protein [bacterium]MCM1376434.1 WG repeat-containing protein [Muribaculum sp.]